MFYVLFPTEAEAGPYLDMLDDVAGTRLARRQAYIGRSGGASVTVILCGIGQANAAQAVASVCESSAPALAVLGGCAGAYVGSGLGVGDVAVAVEETYAELGVASPGGFVTLEEAGLPLMEFGERPVYESIPIPEGAGIDLNIFDRLGFGVKSGGFLTVSTVTGTMERGEELFGRFGALCENMEGAAAAQVAAHYGVPFIELRGVSNMVVDRDRGSWDIGLAAANCAAAIRRILEMRS